MTTYLPYKFEPGMRVHISSAGPGIIFAVDDLVPTFHIFTEGQARGWWGARYLTADIDNAGTRGLLLQQYRDASGHRDAQPAKGADGRWRMCPRPFSGDEPTGEGESEGACIIDALTRLARGDDHGIFVAAAADARVAAIVFAPVVRSSITAGELAMMSLGEVKELAGGARIVRTDDAFTLYRDGSPLT